MSKKEQSKSTGPDFAVVGVGASAGGVQALLRLFESAPPSPDVAFVVVLHLSPDHASHAHDVIQSVASLRVQQVHGPVPLEKNHVYVIPPGKHLAMVDGYLRLSDPEPPRLPPTSIDVFFRSLADAHGARAVAVVLSGAGTDGSVGIARVREQGGITIAQRPEEAQYGEMPRNAIATGDVDLVLPVAEIIPRLLELVRSAAQIELPAPSDPDEPPGGTDSLIPDAGAIDEVLETLRTRTQHDFSNYKRGTIVRRIERRMQVNGLTTAAAYNAFLTANSDETPRLLADMLIGVTNFFRDPSAFGALEERLHTEFANGKYGQEELRAWVPACATGEEAFSIAILLDEISRRLPHRPRVAVFASDIDQRAIAIARAGSYPAAIANDVSPARLAQYFHKEGNRYRLTKSLRDTVIFAAHNLLSDPPFSRINLISCRNLLIYLDRRAQSRVVEAFHFALRPAGLLFLGTAESADFAQEFFEPINKQKKIYRSMPRTASNGLPTYPNFQVQPYIGGGQAFFSLPVNDKPVQVKIPSQTQSLDLFGPPVMVIRTDGEIVYRSANANRLTEDLRRTRAVNLFDVVRDDVHARVRQAIERCVSMGRRGDEEAVPFETASGDIAVTLSLRPFRDLGRDEDLISLTCDLLAPFPTTTDAALRSEPGEETVDSLKQALAGSEDRLRNTLEDARNSGEELRASNEELQAMNEELRSASEELEASREELQSLNEELVTVNTELLVKVQEAARVGDDLKNLIALVGVATIFVDRTLSIKRYTSPAETLFNILPADTGRPLEHLTHKLDYPEMIDDLRAAFQSLRTVEKEVQSNDARSFLARVIPYRTDDDRIDGAVLALIDISEQKAAQMQARASEEKLRLAAQETHDFAIIVLGDDGLVVSWNVGASRIFGYQSDEMLGRPLDAIFANEDVAAGVPREECNKARSTGRAEDERWHLKKGGMKVFCSGFLSRIDVPGFSGFAKIVHDATNRKLVEGKKDMALARERADHDEIRKLNRLKDEFIAVLSHELKNPLNLIHVKAEILARMPEAQHVGRIQEIADAIQKSVLTQAQIIDDLLDSSRIQTGKLALHFAPTDVTKIARSITEAVRDDAAAREIHLEVEVPAEPLIIRADAVRIEQIVWNLVSNALKFTPSGGHVSVRLRQEANKVRLEVADTGIGVAPPLLESIFEIFQQAPNVRSRVRSSGLGIGLSLVRQLAQLHGGTAEAFSEGEGRGARFLVWLPADAASAHRRVGASPADLSIFEGVRVLVVDDSAESLTAMADLLSLYKAKVHTSASAKQALDLLAASEFELIITDVNLPELDGYELARRVRQLETGSSVAIVAVTGRPIGEEEGVAREAGCDACLAKPFNIHALAEVLRLQQNR
ncbi:MULTISPECIES: chemotaxis protein CheB [unclassified Caballeronia]|uniref:chemotaxis protein CheB n=1 Tax=unclassified Caballeronia TaxID=2646786 RepID=UPI00285AE23E|nr:MULTISPECIES: chemotaxis protein CheB [unclassified Caballeronia]MDR5763084.1 chemotaxis protein CheB [Caballeronia sp. LZ035]MDR5883918.1 chemotaxis protein CheB [Caballeronia sp. LZ032]